MIVPNIPLEDFIRRYGFKHCAGQYKDNVYLCVSRGVDIIVVSEYSLQIIPWRDNDPRIGEPVNCNFEDKRDSLDIFYQLVSDGAVKGSWE
jgi:hypothetical protein